MLKYNDYIDERMTSRLTCSMYIQDQYRGGSRGRVQGVRTPPEMTCGFLIQLVFCQTMWFIGVEVEQEKSAPPPKKNPGSAPAIGHFTVVSLVSSGCKESQFYSLPFEQAVASLY